MKICAKKEKICVYIVLSIALLLRLAQLFILRNQVYVLGEDEIRYVGNGLRMIFDFLKPDFFFHGSLYFYVIAFLYCCLFIIGNLSGFLGGAASFFVFFLERPEVFYFIGRMVSVSANIAAIYFVYYLGAYLWDRKTGLIAMFLFSLLPAVLLQSTKASVYPLANLLIIIAALYGVRYWKTAGSYRAFLPGIFFGLALAADYYALFLIPFFILIFYAVNHAKHRNADSCIFFVLAFFVFIIVNPYFFFSFPSVWHSILEQAQAASSGPCINRKGLLGYGQLLLKPPYLFISFFFCFGVWISLKRRKIGELALALFPIINIVFFSFSKIQLDHYIFHSLPFMSLVAAHAIIVSIYYKKSNVIKACFIALAVVYVFFSLHHFRFNFDNSSDEGWIAKEWVEKNIPKKSSILMQPGTIPFAQPRLLAVLFNPENSRNEGLYFSALERYLVRHPEEDYEIKSGNFLKNTISYVDYMGIQYIVLSEIDYDHDGVKWLQRNAKLIKAFGERGDIWKIRIYEVRNPTPKETEEKRWW